MADLRAIFKTALIKYNARLRTIEKRFGKEDGGIFEQQSKTIGDIEGVVMNEKGLINIKKTMQINPVENFNAITHAIEGESETYTHIKKSILEGEAARNKVNEKHGTPTKPMIDPVLFVKQEANAKAWFDSYWSETLDEFYIWEQKQGSLELMTNPRYRELVDELKRQKYVHSYTELQQLGYEMQRLMDRL